MRDDILLNLYLVQWLYLWKHGNACFAMSSDKTKTMATLTKQDVWNLLEQVSDPEIPVLTVIDLGIVRDVKLHDDGLTEVVITPTYSGCPAMNMIEVNIRSVLQENGIEPDRKSTRLNSSHYS